MKSLIPSQQKVMSDLDRSPTAFTPALTAKTRGERSLVHSCVLASFNPKKMQVREWPGEQTDGQTPNGARPERLRDAGEEFTSI